MTASDARIMQIAKNSEGFILHGNNECHNR